MSEFDYQIDENGLLVLRVEPDFEQAIIKFRLSSEYSQRSELVRNILPLLSVGSAGDIFVPNNPEFNVPIPFDGASLSLKINNQVYADVVISIGKVDIISFRKLSVFETRIIGRAPQMEMPFPLSDLQVIRGPITDIHTHLSGQSTARHLIELGCRHEVLYPTVALDKLAVRYPLDRLAIIPKRAFLPLAHLQVSDDMTETAVPLTELGDEALQSLQNALSLSPEGQSTYEDMEICYYFREPFTKNLLLLPEMLRGIAEAYREQGIKYAALSSNAVLDPEWLKVMHDVLPEIENDTGVQLRFLAGLPRNLDEDAIIQRIDQIKRVSKSPYVVGVDILGYEMNKTSHLQQHLEELAEWIRDFQPDMVLRIHAGENPKNPANVKECLRLADQYGIRLRVGHAVYGIDDETIQLAQKLANNNKLIIEANPDSNLAGNNIDYPDELSAWQFIQAGVPSVLASDGAGLYLTSARQTAMAGLFCGITPNGFDFIHRVELAHIAEQQQIFEQKQCCLPEDFFEQLSMPIPKRRKSGPIVMQSWRNARRAIAPTNGRCPILVAGAAGSSWDLIEEESKRELRLGLRLLIEHLHPDKAFFTIGRTKDRGVGIELGKAIFAYNAVHSKKFICTMMLAEDRDDTDFIPTGINGKVDLDVPLVFLPNAVLSFIKEHQGLAIFAGGRSFTRDFILESIRQGIPCGLMTEASGASAEKARIFPEMSFSGAIGMVQHTARLNGNIFADRPGNEQIVQIYRSFHESHQRL